MNLTPVQEKMVTAYFVHCGQIMKDLSEAARARSIRLARLRLRDELVLLKSSTLEDATLTTILSSLEPTPSGWLSPRAQLTVIEEAPAEDSRHAGFGPSRALGSSRRRWLGVCLVLSRRMNVPLPAIRSAFLIGALIAAPFALIVYLGLYLEMYVESNRATVPRVDVSRVLQSVGYTVVALCVLYAGTAVVRHASILGFERLSNSSYPFNPFSSVLNYNASAFLAALVVLLPLAVLQGLPVPDLRRRLLRKMLYTGLAIYSLAVCVGLAAFFTGTLLAVIDRFA